MYVNNIVLYGGETRTLNEKRVRGSRNVVLEKIKRTKMMTNRSDVE